jgi:hypothetical protein
VNTGGGKFGLGEGLVPIRWLTASLDVPVDRLELDSRFWEAVTATKSSPGQVGESTTLVPDTGDAYLRMQRATTGSGGCHLIVHTDDPAALTKTAVGLGGREEHHETGTIVARSPGGLRFYVVVWHGEQRRPLPKAWPGGQRSLVDQLCIDIPPDAFGGECDFWAELTGWEHRGGGPEFRYLPRPAGIPLRLLLQRLDDPRAGSSRSHLDLACSDVAAECRRHEALGATVAYEGRVWTTLQDPAGIVYCITRRDPDTGTL